MNIAYRIVAVTEPVPEQVVEEVHTTTPVAETEHVVGESTADTAHTTESTGHGAEEESQGIAALGIDPMAIGAQLLTFLVLFWVIKKFALSGIVKNLQKRHEDINRGLHLTAELDKQKSELDQRVEELLKVARKDADKVIAEAHTESSKIIQTAEATAIHKAEEILKAAEGKIERDIADARNGLKSEMAGLITDATEAILNQKLDAGSDRKLVENYLKEAMK